MLHNASWMHDVSFMFRLISDKIIRQMPGSEEHYTTKNKIFYSDKKKNIFEYSEWAFLCMIPCF